MFSLPLAWTMLTISLWTSGLCQIHRDQTLQNGTLNRIYPKIGETASIDCDCGSTCEYVYWFRSSVQENKVEFIGSYNNADRSDHGKEIEKARFLFSRRGSSFSLRVVSVTVKDTAVYSCLMKVQKSDVWKPGSLLLPGVTPPTPPPPVKTTTKTTKRCRCKTSRSSSPDGCDSLILWSLIGLIVGLALAIICTLYYFSRLPKKCRHRFTKRR